MGNKVQIGTVQGDAIAGNKIVNANTAELLQLITSLRQTAATFPKEIQEELTIDLDDVEIELKKPEADRNPTKLKNASLPSLPPGPSSPLRSQASLTSPTPRSISPLKLESNCHSNEPPEANCDHDMSIPTSDRSATQGKYDRQLIFNTKLALTAPLAFAL